MTPPIQRKGEWSPHQKTQVTAPGQEIQPETRCAMYIKMWNLIAEPNIVCYVTSVSHCQRHDRESERSGLLTEDYVAVV